MPPEEAVSSWNTTWTNGWTGDHWSNVWTNEASNFYFSSVSPSIAYHSALPVFDVPGIIRDITVVALIQCLRGIDDQRRKQLETERSRAFAAALKHRYNKPVMHDKLAYGIVHRRVIQQPRWRSGRYKSKT